MKTGSEHRNKTEKSQETLSISEPPASSLDSLTIKNELCQSQAWGAHPESQLLGRLEQEDQKFKVCLSDRGCSRPD